MMINEALEVISLLLLLLLLLLLSGWWYAYPSEKHESQLG